MTALDDMGELGPIIRELIHSITLHRDDSGRLGIEVEGYLTPFLQQDGKPLKSDETMGAVAMVAEDRYRQSPYLPNIRYRLRLFSRLLAA